MSSETCISAICFYALDSDAPRLFGFAEYLTGLALMVLAWTTADTRYQFRIETAPIPLKWIAYISVTLVGVLTLLTDLWRAQEWLVPVGTILTPAIWQAFLGLVFLLTFLSWAWFAFIRPASFGVRNAERFTRSIYRAILRASPTELAVIADEVVRSASQLIELAPVDRSRHRQAILAGGATSATMVHAEVSEVEGYANDFLLLIADRRFCRAVVSSGSALVLALLREVAAREKYSIAIGTFIQNIVGEALTNKDSFLFHETEGYEAGLLGYYKPLSQAIFGDYSLLSGVGTALDVNLGALDDADAETWSAYCRAALVALRGYVEADLSSHPTVFFRLQFKLKYAVGDVYKLNGVTSFDWHDGPYAKLRTIVDFLKESLKVLDQKPVSPYIALRVRQKYGQGHSIYDVFAELIFEVLFCAASVRTPLSTCWTIQHNTVWSDLFDSFSPHGEASSFVKHKARRLIYDEVIEMTRFPNFKGAKYLAICLNTMGLNPVRQIADRDSRALHRSLLAWTRKNYASLYATNPEVAEECLVDGITYEPENSRIVKTYPAGGLRKNPSFVYLQINSPRIASITPL